MLKTVALYKDTDNKLKFLWWKYEPSCSKKKVKCYCIILQGQFGGSVFPKRYKATSTCTCSLCDIPRKGSKPAGQALLTPSKKKCKQKDKLLALVFTRMLLARFNIEVSPKTVTNLAVGRKWCKLKPRFCYTFSDISQVNAQSRLRVILADPSTKLVNNTAIKVNQDIDVLLCFVFRSLHECSSWGNHSALVQLNSSIHFLIWA